MISGKNFTEISDIVSFKDFEQMKEFILEKGDKMTYRNFDNNNPHYKLSNFDLFLGSDVGQKNIYNDPKISDFNQLTITDRSADIKYYEIIIVRKGDLKAKKDWIKKGMDEEQIYLVDVYSKGLKLMRNNLSSYLKQIKKVMSANNI